MSLNQAMTGIRRRLGTKLSCNLRLAEEIEDNDQPAQSELPIELLESIISHLFAVCKLWQAAAISVRRASKSPWLSLTGWLGIYDPEKGTWSVPPPKRPEHFFRNWWRGKFMAEYNPQFASTRVWNWERLEPRCDLMLYLKVTFNVNRKDKKVSIRSKDMLQVGDKIDRPLIDGDIVFINRPPSIHQHSLIAMSVKVLSTKSFISINPLVCSPLRVSIAKIRVLGVAYKH